MTDAGITTSARGGASKRERLREVARRRVAARWPGYRHPEDYGYDFRDLVSPYSRTAGNVDADVMLVLQDWSSHDHLVERGFDPEVARLGHTPGLLTNKRLKQLLARHFGLQLEDTFGTNVFPFIKSGNISAAIPLRDLVRAARDFAIPQIQIVSPRIVIALGKRTGQALERAGARFYELPHPAARISTKRMDEAWQRCRADAGITR